jgi:hypothetical protein
VSPDDPLVRHVVDRSDVMRLATISAHGHPSVTPLWFVVHEGAMIAGTAASTVAARNVAADPRVTVLVDGERAGRSTTIVRLRARAAVHPGLPPAAVMARLAAKYYLTPAAARSEARHVRQWTLRRRYYAQAEAVWISIEPASAELLPVPGGGV